MSSWHSWEKRFFSVDTRYQKGLGPLLCHYINILVDGEELEQFELSKCHSTSERLRILELCRVQDGADGMLQGMPRLSSKCRGPILDSLTLSHPPVFTDVGLAVMQGETLTNKYPTVYVSLFTFEATLKYRVPHRLLGKPTSAEYLLG